MLPSRGLSKEKISESEKPDLLITANGCLTQQTSYTAMSMGGWGGGSATVSAQQNVIEMLIVDLYNAASRSLVWHGIAQNTLNTNSNKNQQLVQKSVAKMFKQWPKS